MSRNGAPAPSTEGWPPGTEETGRRSKMMMVRAYHEVATKAFEGIIWTKPVDRAGVAARRIARSMQEAGALPTRMSDGRFSDVAAWIQAAMIAASENSGGFAE